MCLHPPSSDHRPTVQSVSLGLFCRESKAHDCSWLGRSREGADIYQVDWWFDFSEHVDGFSLALFKMKKLRFSCLSDILGLRGVSCSLLPPDSPSDSPTGWALAQVPEICSGRASGSQSTCPWSPGPYNFSFSHWESFQCKWSKIYFLDRIGNVAETKKATLGLCKKAPLSI